MTSATRLYGRKGFTMKKSIRAVLEPYEGPFTRRSARRVHIKRITAADAALLLPQLPEAQWDDQSSEGGPTLAEMVKFAGTIDGLVLSGFRVEPEDLNERITFSRILVPHEHMTPAIIHEFVKGAQALGDINPEIGMAPDGAICASWE